MLLLSDAGAVVEQARRRLAGAYTVDAWGLDRDVHAAVGLVLGARWDVSIGGQTNVPADGPAVLVANDRLGSLAPLAAVVALGRDLGRVVRFVGVPDIEPVATALRRVGGVLERPDELGAILRDGHLGVVWCRSAWRGGPRVGPVRADLLAVAAHQRVPVLPLAIHGRRFGRVLRVEVGSPIVRSTSRPAGRRSAGPLAGVELAAAARAALQLQIDEAAPSGFLWR